MFTYREKLLSADKWEYKCPHIMIPQFIVVHNTANDASAENEIAYMQGNNDLVSFHYAVDEKEVIKAIPEYRNAYHAGDGTYGEGNRKGLSVEICYSKSGGKRFTAAEENAAEFIADLLILYGWDITKVRKHQDFSGKYCPHRTLELGWDTFLHMIQKHLDEKKPKLVNADEITWELNHSYFPITDFDGFIKALDEGKKNDSPLYWGYYKLVNRIKE